MYRQIIPLLCLLFIIACSSQQTISTTSSPLEVSESIILEPNLDTPSEREVVNEIAPAKETSKKMMSEEPTKILWDKWGVPHIYARNNSELFYAFGWSQMHNHANTILKLYAKSRGRAAEYWGKQYLENDMMVHAKNIRSCCL